MAVEGEPVERGSPLVRSIGYLIILGASGAVSLAQFVPDNRRIPLDVWHEHPIELTPSQFQVVASLVVILGGAIWYLGLGKK